MQECKVEMAKRAFLLLICIFFKKVPNLFNFREGNFHHVTNTNIIINDACCNSNLKSRVMITS